MKRTLKAISCAALLMMGMGAQAQDAEYQLIRRQYTVNNDGTVDINFRKEIKLLRNRAITAYADKGETFILYNPATDRLTINESYTVRKDGSHVPTPANAFVDQLPSSCQDCGRYNGLRERVVVHTALEYDCIVVLDYTIRRKTDRLNEHIVLSEDCPVKKYEIVYDVKAAEKDGLKYGFGRHNFANPPKFVNDVENGWHLVATNLPQSYNDSYLPPADELYPSVDITLGEDNNAADDSERLPEADNLLAELHDRDAMTYVTNIRDYVVDDIHTNDIAPALLGYRVSTAQETFRGNCGTPADKQQLLATLLRQAGFDARNLNDHVELTLNEGNGPVSYRLNATDKRPLRPDGAAIDEQRTIDVTEELLWQGTNLGGGYKQMQLPDVKGSINIDPARLTSVRTAPLKVRNCNEKYHYTVVLMRTPKHSLVKPVDINYSQSGLGSIRIRIKQNDNGTIDVVRELNIDVENGIVTPKQYKTFRQMMQDWATHRTITVKAAPRRPIN